jgi:peroxiredoxin
MRITILVFFLAISVLCSAQSSFFYQLSYNPRQKGLMSTLYISYEYGGVKITDSMLIGKKQYTFSKRIKQPVAAEIYTNNKVIKGLPVFLANNQLNVAIEKNAIVISYDKWQQPFLDLTMNDRIRPRYFYLYEELNRKNDTVELRKLSVLFDSLRLNDIDKAYRYFQSNTGTLLSLFAFSRFASFSTDYAKVETDFKKLPAWCKNTPDGKNITEKLAGSKSALVNTPAPDFSQLSDGGTAIDLHSFRGKYVLLDFWASWCGPCRKEHPNLSKAYSQFKAKNFEIVSVSLDNDRRAWLNAIKKDKLIWSNISDLKGQQNAVALKYGVQTIPSNFLIDTDGLIIAKNLTGEELLEKLAGVLK